MTPEPSINFKCEGGAEFDAHLDGDGDLYVSVTNDTMAAMYLSGPEAASLRDWLVKTLPASCTCVPGGNGRHWLHCPAQETSALCPHGYELRNLQTGTSICEPCGPDPVVTDKFTRLNR